MDERPRYRRDADQSANWLWLMPPWMRAAFTMISVIFYVVIPLAVLLHL